jgi:hypothetical protein
MIKHNPRALFEPPELILEKIKNEIRKNNYLPALFLEASAIEGYLISLIRFSGIQRNKIKKESEQLLERMQISHSVNTNYILGNIDGSLYKKITTFNTERNKFAHNLIGIDFNDPNFMPELKDLTKKGLCLCEELSKIHFAKINENWITMTSDHTGVGRASTMTIKVANSGSGNSHLYKIIMEEGQAPSFDVKKTENGIEVGIYGEWEIRELIAFLSEYRKYLATEQV